MLHGDCNYSATINSRRSAIVTNHALSKEAEHPSHLHWNGIATDPARTGAQRTRHLGMRPFRGSNGGHWKRVPGGRANWNLVCTCGSVPAGCVARCECRSHRQRGVGASMSTANALHLRCDRLLRSMEDPFYLSVQAMLKDTKGMHVASVVDAHLNALRHWWKRRFGSRVRRRRRYVGTLSGRPPNK